MKKNNIIIICGIIGILFLSGCTTQNNQNQVELKVGDINTNAIQAAAGVNSYTYTMTTTSNLPGEDGGETDVSITGNCVIDVTSKKVMTYSLTPATGSTAEINTLIYVIDDIQYTNTTTEGSSEWLKENVTDWSSSYDQVQSQKEFMDIPGIKRSNDETVDGVDCYVIEINPDLTDPSSLPSSFEEMSEMISELKIKQWIEKDTYFIKKIDMQITMNVFTFSMTSKSVMIFSDYNKPVTIELPEEAESAEWAPDTLY